VAVLLDLSRRSCLTGSTVSADASPATTMQSMSIRRQITMRMTLVLSRSTAHSCVSPPMHSLVPWMPTARCPLCRKSAHYRPI
jgi:hypothetical protein